MELKELELIASKCKLCNLYETRNKPVFAKGNPDAEIMVVGMCPGPDENKSGIPFVGYAGKILDEILVEAFEEDRKNVNLNKYYSVYITNLVKCFVNPGIQLDNIWMSSCLPYLITQIGMLEPKVIIGLGKNVSNYLLRNTKTMKEMRGKVFTYLGDITFISTYHPSYLARSGGIKHKHFNKVVRDFRTAIDYL